jgi:hypothetical protein
MFRVLLLTFKRVRCINGAGAGKQLSMARRSGAFSCPHLSLFWHTSAKHNRCQVILGFGSEEVQHLHRDIAAPSHLYTLSRAPCASINRLSELKKRINPFGYLDQ